MTPTTHQPRQEKPIMTANTNPAETLRAAAAKLRATARPAHAAPWYADADELGRGYDVRSWMNARHLAFGLTEADAGWVALAHPGLAAPLAAWLEATADGYATSTDEIECTNCGEAGGCDHPAEGEFCDRCEGPVPCGCVSGALAVARVILGEVAR